MADTTSFETTEITDAQTIEDSIQLAQAAAVELSSPGRGKEAAVSAEAGQTYSLKGPQIRYTQDGADLVVHWADGGHTKISEYFVFFAPGTPGGIAGMPYESLTAAIPNFDPSAFTPAAGAPVPAPAPAAGPGQAAGGAFNTEFNGEFGIEGIGIGGLLGQTELQFVLLQPNPEILPFFPPALLAEELGPCDVFPPCPDPEALKSAFLASWQRGDGETIVIEAGEGDPDAIGSRGDDTIIGDYRGNLLIGDEWIDDDEWFDQDDGGNDLLKGYGGNDTLVGDFYDTSGADLTVVVENFSEGDGQVFDSFNDCLDGGEGKDTLVGDVYYDTTSGDMTVELTVSNYYGDDNVFNAFSDFLDGGSGWDTLVGDVFFEGVGSTNRMSLELAVSNNHGDDNEFNAFNDILWGGDGGGFMVGDVFVKGLDTGNDVVSSDISIDLEVSNHEGDGNEFNAFNDILIGGENKDFMVGDVFIKINSDDTHTNSTWDVDLLVSNDEGNDNVFNAFNDHLCAFGGDDVMVGDVYFWDTDGYNEHNVEISLLVSNDGGGGDCYGYGGDGNVFNVFNDTMAGGAGNDVIVGDVYMHGVDMTDRDITVELEVSNYYGDNNTFSAFNDLIHGGTEPPMEEYEFVTQSEKRSGGDDTLVGDVYIRDVDLDDDCSASMDVELRVTNYHGDNNTFDVFNDLMIGGDGNDTIVGDVYFRDMNMDSVPLSLDLEVRNNRGDDNTYDAFNDFMCGGAGKDDLVGDVYLRDVDVKDDTVTVQLDVSNRYGDGNSFKAFSDVMIGHDGWDTLVGDVFFENVSWAIADASLDMIVSNYRGDINTFNAFNDTLIGGEDGGGTVVGDVYFRDVSGYNGTLSLDLKVSNYQGDNNEFNAFNDILRGGDGWETMVGDVYLRDFENENRTTSLDLRVTNYDGDNNEFNAFNDTLIGGDGGGKLVGDVYLRSGGPSLSQTSLDLVVSNYGSDDNAFNAFNDTLIGGDGRDTIVGDVYIRQDTREGDTDGHNVRLVVSNYNGDNNQFHAFNDTLRGGSDNDVMVGDVFFNQDDSSDGMNLSLSMAVSNSVGEGGEGGNTFNAFNDRLIGGAGDDTLVGDAYVLDTDQNVNVRMTVRNNRADGNTFEAYNDILDASEGGVDGQAIIDEATAYVTGGFGEGCECPKLYFPEGATLVGDVFFDGSSGCNDIELMVFGEGGGDNNSFKAFSDTLTGGVGDDTLVGDVFYRLDPDSPNEPMHGDVSLVVSNASNGDGNTFEAFNDTLLGGAGVDTIVGDVFYDVDDDGSGDVSLVVSNSNGDNNTFDAFNDVLDAGENGLDFSALIEALMACEDDYDNTISVTNIVERPVYLSVPNPGSTLIGDVFSWDVDGDVMMTVTNQYGDNNSFTVFEDMLTGGTGDDTLVGDLHAVDWDNNRDDHVLEVGNFYGNDNTFNAFRDDLRGGAGDDHLVGDVLFEDYHWYDGFDTAGIFLTVRNEGDGNNTFNAFNDILDGGAGDDDLIGDVAYIRSGFGEGGADISLSVNNRFNLADNNTFNAFNDVLMAAAGADLLVGDVLLDQYGDGGAIVELSVVNGESDTSRKPDDNVFEAFNDTMFGGTGDDLLVGDVLSFGEGHGHGESGIDLAAENWYGNDNAFQTFNDTMSGGDGYDILVGDVLTESDAPVSLRVSTKHGDDNTFMAFNDTMTGGADDDFMIGDVAMEDDRLTYEITALGDDDSVSAFNNSMEGNAGDDVLIGNALTVNGIIVVDVEADDIDETVTAFCDDMKGGAGEDVLIGDFVALGTTDISLFDVLEGNFDPGAVGIDDAIGGLYTGALSVTLSGISDDDKLFGDTIDGGADDDILWGQLGDDDLTGGGGADIFFYANADNSLGSGNLGDGHDTITDFTVGDFDMVDLDALFDLLGINTAGTAAEDRADLVEITTGGGDSVLTIDHGSAGDFSITFTGVDMGGTGTAGQFDAAGLATLGINVGDES